MSDSNQSSARLKMSEVSDLHDRHEAFTTDAYGSTGVLPDRYVFVLTNLCNLDCHFCFQERKPRKGFMTTQDWLNLAEQLPDYARVTLTGGEPLVFKGFRDVFSFVANRFDCNMICNGVLLTTDIIDYVLSYPRFRVLSISIDNIGNTARGVKKEKWDHAEAMMRYFSKRRDELNSTCVLDAKTVVLDENASELLEIHKYCIEELSCDTHSFMFLKGSPTQHADFMVPVEAILKKSQAPTYQNFDAITEQLNAVREYNVRTGAVAFLHPFVGSLVSTEPLQDLRYLNNPNHVTEQFEACKFPWSSVHVNVDGSLFPCMAIRMGNVKETSLTEIINGPAYTEFRTMMLREGTVEGCNRCGWLRPRNLV